MIIGDIPMPHPRDLPAFERWAKYQRARQQIEQQRYAEKQAIDRKFDELIRDLEAAHCRAEERIMRELAVRLEEAA